MRTGKDIDATGILSYGLAGCQMSTCHSATLIKISKESEPIGPGIDFTPEGWRLPFDAQWNDGIVEKWNSGYKNRNGTVAVHQ